MIASRIERGEPLEAISFVPYASDKGAGTRFLRLALAQGTEPFTLLAGDPFPIPEPEIMDTAHLKHGHALVMTPPGEAPYSVLMVLLIRPDDPESPVLFAEINPVYLWGVGSEGSLRPEVDMIIRDRDRRILLSSIPAIETHPDFLSRIRQSSSSGDFQFEVDGEPYLASYWELFTKPRFSLPGWTIILCESKTDILRPVSYFKTFFLLMILLTFWIVALLSVVLIRKSLVPITTLREATERIAQGDLETRVDIQSGDEFETLGHSFNEMGRKLEEGQRLLVQSAKMGAFGQMAAGVVHEIGQPLTSLQGLVELVLDGPLDGESKSHLELVQSELLRLRDMVVKFRSFSKSPKGVQEPVSINQVLEETYHLLEHQFRMKRIHCALETGDGLPQVQGDRNGLQQVLVNLIVNAMHAVEDQSGGNGLIEIRSALKDGQVAVSVSDNGPGIPKDIQERIFDPFFTTKGAGEGTGLGLAITLSIVHQHKGTIHLDSDPGTGTRFTILLPSAPSEP